MHVGTGDYSVSIIDNEVSRDVVDNAPNINGSGVKGALREYFDSHINDAIRCTEIFGGKRIKNKEENKEKNKGENNAETNGKDEKDSAVQGKLKFFSANLLARPVRASSGKQPYYLVTTKTLVERFNQLCQALGIANSINLDDKNKKVINIEGEFSEGPVIDIWGQQVYIIDEQKFNDFELPVVARNQVKREAIGEREAVRGNLWFEEIVPYNSLFYFFVLANDGDEALLKDFSSEINEKVVQFGGNASVGYGYTVLADKTEQKGEN